MCPCTRTTSCAASASQGTLINIADAPITLTLTNPNLIVGANNNVVVGTFTDGNPYSTAAAYQAVINWGDGIVSSATVANGGIVATGPGSFEIIGWHTYAQTATGLSFSVSVYDWSASDGPYSATQMLTGGPTGGAFRQESLTLTTETDVVHLFNLPETNGAYNPSSPGRSRR